ncbi:hypothetical protein SESBI_41556 [Sesbania bispinosa]|nr:hypothetical protein SESBI_41556 [Sesbania bispinosa]
MYLIFFVKEKQHLNDKIKQSTEVRVYEKPGTSICAAFITNNHSTEAATIGFRGSKYFLPAHSISVLPDCKTEIVSQHNSRNYVKSGVANNHKWEVFNEEILSTKKLPTNQLILAELYSLLKDKTDYAWYTTRILLQGLLIVPWHPIGARSWGSVISMLIRYSSFPHWDYLCAGANVASRVDMRFAATDPLSEIVWSPDKGLSLRCADSSFADKNNSLFRDVGPSCMVLAPPQSVTGGMSTTDKHIDDVPVKPKAIICTTSDVAATDAPTMNPTIYSGPKPECKVCEENYTGMGNIF